MSEPDRKASRLSASRFAGLALLLSVLLLLVGMWGGQQRQDSFCAQPANVDVQACNGEGP